jgi:hypothetical protein
MHCGASSASLGIWRHVPTKRIRRLDMDIIERHDPPIEQGAGPRVAAGKDGL